MYLSSEQAHKDGKVAAVGFGADGRIADKEVATRTVISELTTNTGL